MSRDRGEGLCFVQVIWLEGAALGTGKRKITGYRWSATVINPTSHSSNLTRREALRAAGATATLAIPYSAGGLSAAASAPTTTDGARLAVSFTFMFGGGGQPISDTGSVMPDSIERGVTDTPTNAFFAFGRYVGIPRVLDLMDSRGIKLSSLNVGKVVEASLGLVQKIGRRGHEGAGQRRAWENSDKFPRDEERRFIAESVETIRRVTGQKPIGWNTYWLRSSVHVLDALQNLGLLNHSEEPTRDKPFIVTSPGSDFGTVPYTFRVNDVVSLPFLGWNAAAYQEALRDEFDQLYDEGARSGHDGAKSP
jgi:peptidoglycan/xylan/chitin deacetylase (PgdA/CDA1 family)